MTMFLFSIAIHVITETATILVITKRTLETDTTGVKDDFFDVVDTIANKEHVQAFI